MKKAIIYIFLIMFFCNIVYAENYYQQQKKQDISRAQYWKKKGYNFDPDVYSAYSMDEKVKDIERSKYWKKKGYNFNPDVYSAYSMDEKVKDIKCSKKWAKQGIYFDPDVYTAYSMDNEGPQKLRKLKKETNTTNLANVSKNRVGIKSILNSRIELLNGTSWSVESNCALNNWLPLNEVTITQKNNSIEMFNHDTNERIRVKKIH